MRNIEANLKRLATVRLSVGIFNKKAKKSATGGLADNLAYRYRINDLGLGRTPKRETLGPSIEKTIKEDRFFKKAIIAELDGPLQFGSAAERAAGNTKKFATKLKTPPKSASTLRAIKKRYGRIRSNPLIVTSEMVNAIEGKEQ